MINVALCSREKIIRAQDLMTLAQELVSQMGTQEAGSAGDENAFAAFVKSRHEILPSACDINNFATPILLKARLMQSKGQKSFLSCIRFVLCGAYAGLIPPFA